MLLHFSFLGFDALKLVEIVFFKSYSNFMHHYSVTLTKSLYAVVST